MKELDNEHFISSKKSAQLQRPYLLTTMAFLLFLFINALLPSLLNGFTDPITLHWTDWWNNALAEEVYHSRLDHPVFGKRIVTLSVLYFLHNYLHLPLAFSFLLINCTLFLGCSILLFNLSRTITGIDHPLSVFLFFWLCFSVLFAFLGRINTYDEPFQYFFLLLALLFFVKKIWWGVMLCFTIGLFTRETSILFLPFFLGNQYRLSPRWWKVAITIMPLGLFILFYFHGKSANPGIDFLVERRFLAWQENFKDFSRTSETLFSLFMVLGIPLQVVRWIISKCELSRGRRAWISWAFGITLFNTVIVLAAGLAREARLFALPLLLLWPILPLAGRSFAKYLENSVKNWSYREWSIVVVISLGTSLFLYQPSMEGTGWVYRGYLFGYLMFFLMMEKVIESR